MTTSAATLTANTAQNDALLCARAAIDKKAEHLKVLDLSELSSFTECFLICNGTNERQVQAIADSIATAMAQAGHRLISAEGQNEGRWVLMDYGHIVCHIFLDALREYYNLEALWADAPQIKIPSDFYGPGASRVN